MGWGAKEATRERWKLSDGSKGEDNGWARSTAAGLD
uniref:Uncharacterized protein n=1 Tax=Arundo donax TaxID=35708 RepID=A0A0A9B686_ARUDO